MDIKHTPLYSERKIIGINGDDKTRRYLANYGILIGQKITKVQESLNIAIYKVDDSLLALDDKEASLILVE